MANTVFVSKLVLVVNKDLTKNVKKIYKFLPNCVTLSFTLEKEEGLMQICYLQNKPEREDGAGTIYTMGKTYQ